MAKKIPHEMCLLKYEKKIYKHFDLRIEYNDFKMAAKTTYIQHKIWSMLLP